VRENQITFVFELKLVGEGHRYWLCTKGWPGAKLGGSFEYLVQDYVQPEYQNEQGNWETGCPYGPEQTKFLQGMDYLHFLMRLVDQLDEQQELARSPETDKQIEETKEEIRKLITVLKVTDGKAGAAQGQAEVKPKWKRLKEK